MTDKERLDFLIKDGGSVIEFRVYDDASATYGYCPKWYGKNPHDEIDWRDSPRDAIDAAMKGKA